MKFKRFPERLTKRSPKESDRHALILQTKTLQVLTGHHEALCLVLDVLAQLTHIGQVLQDVDVGRKVHHVLFATPVGQP